MSQRKVLKSYSTRWIIYFVEPRMPKEFLQYDPVKDTIRWGDELTDATFFEQKKEARLILDMFRNEVVNRRPRTDIGKAKHARLMTGTIHLQLVAFDDAEVFGFNV